MVLDSSKTTKGLTSFKIISRCSQYMWHVKWVSTQSDCALWEREIFVFCVIYRWCLCDKCKRITNTIDLSLLTGNAVRNKAKYLRAVWQGGLLSFHFALLLTVRSAAGNYLLFSQQIDLLIIFSIICQVYIIEELLS